MSTSPATTKGAGAPAPIRGMVGSHLSVAGGAHHALEEAIRLGLDCVQVFTRNQRQWKAPPLTDEAIAQWKATRASIGWDDRPERVVSHNSYLVNLASPDDDLRTRSIELQRDELERCEALGIAWCVAHPGAHLGAARDPKSPNVLRGEPNADEAAGLRRIAQSLDTIHRALKGYRVQTCLETTTGSGTNLGYDFGHLRRIRELVKEPERIAFCLDSCHVTSAGYDMSSPAAAEATLEEFGQVCGKTLLKVLHINDSQMPPGSRKDRHEHIGKGTCGLACFEAIMRDPDLAFVPKILETEKDDAPDGSPWDAVNAETLRRMLPAQRTRSSRAPAPKREQRNSTRCG
jgi:deoxyribonuclease-4